MRSTRHSRSSGFSLVEVIVALVLIGVVAAVATTFISNSMTQVHRPRETLSAAFSIQAVMENVVARHAALGDLSDLSAEIGPENSSANNSLGIYQVQHNRFIAFNNSNDEISTTTNSLLKVSIQNDLGEKITRLFSGRTVRCHSTP